MKTVQKVVLPFLLSILPFAGFCLIAAVILYDGPSFLNYSIASLLVILGFFLSRGIFKLIQKRGVVNVLTGSNATYDVNHLEPSPRSGVQKMSPDDFAKAFKNGEIKDKGYTLSIWGDWDGRELNFKHFIKEVIYDLESDALSIVFERNCLLKIRKAGNVCYTKSYIKIARAKEILWQIDRSETGLENYSYLHVGNELKTQSNTLWEPHPLDIGVGMDALYMQG